MANLIVLAVGNFSLPRRAIFLACGQVVQAVAEPAMESGGDGIQLAAQGVESRA
jgi:hypothetical protein